MSFYAILQGDEIEFVLTGVNATPTKTIVVVNSSNKLTVNGKKVALLDDIKNTPPLTVTYSTPTHSIPGAGNLVCKNWTKISSKNLKDGKGVAITDSSSFFGEGELQVTAPAQMPGSPPTPDPNPKYSCKFLIKTEQKKLTIKQ